MRAVGREKVPRIVEELIRHNPTIDRDDSFSQSCLSTVAKEGLEELV
jgi:hypothetical protein